MSWESYRRVLQRACVAQFSLDLPATYRPQSGGEYPVRVIFRDEHSELQVAEGASVSTLNPVAHVRLEDLQAPPLEGDELLVPSRNATYTIRDKRPDGEGMVELELRRIDP